MFLALKLKKSRHVKITLDLLNKLLLDNGKVSEMTTLDVISYRGSRVALVNLKVKDRHMPCTLENLLKKDNYFIPACLDYVKKDLELYVVVNGACNGIMLRFQKILDTYLKNNPCSGLELNSFNITPNETITCLLSYKLHSKITYKEIETFIARLRRLNYVVDIYF